MKDTISKELSKDSYKFMNDTQAKNHRKKTVAYFKDILNITQYILDIGRRSPLTDELEISCKTLMVNTTGDLDVNFKIPNFKYDVVIYSHTIEHQYNPLNTLLRIHEVLRNDGKLYILLPDRGKLLWCKGHYNELDDYRLKLLLERCDFKVISKIRQKIWRNWYEYIFGIRPILRLFREYHAIYCISKK